MCARGLYQLQLSGFETDCIQCPEHVFCPGGYSQLQLEAGYWRNSTETVDIFYCLNNPRACAGNDTCLEGYAGVLCEVCISGYEPKGGYTCSKCKDLPLIITIMVGLSLFIILYILISVRHNKKKVNEIMF